MSTVTARMAIPFQALSQRGLLWHAQTRVPLNALDARVSADVYQAYITNRSTLYIYPVPCHILPSIIVATILVNVFGHCLDRMRVPRVLFYTGIDGRDLYRDLGVGLQQEKISETFGFTRLNSDGLPIEAVKLTSQLPLVVTGHCVLPKDQGYKPNVVVVDADVFDARKLDALIKAAAKRWPSAIFFVVSSNPVTPLIGASSQLRWRLLDLLHPVEDFSAPVIHDAAFENVSAQLQQLRKGILYRCEVVANDPGPSWRDLSDSLTLARKHRGTSRAARQFVALTRLFMDLAVLPSEYDAYRTAHMFALSDRLRIMRDEARNEGKTAQLIAGGCTVLSDVCSELEKRNWKREALLEIILEYCYAGKNVTILVERAGMRAVLAQTMQLLPEYIDMLQDDRLKIVTASDMPRAGKCDVVVVPGTLATSSMWALRTAVAPEMVFLCYKIETALQAWCLREVGLLDARDSLLDGGGQRTEPAQDAPQNDSISIDLGELLLQDADASEETAAATSATLVGPRREICFDDGTSSVVSDYATLQVVTENEESLQQKRARSLEPGDWVVLVNGDAQQSLFEGLREHVDSKTSLSHALEIVRAFQHALRATYKASGLGVDELHRRLIGLGSEIQHATSVMQWIDGTLLGPSDDKDIARLGAALQIPLFENRYREFYRAMQRVRVAHRELGRVLVRVIKNAYRETDSKSVRISVEGEPVVLYDVLHAVNLKRVYQVKELK